MHSRHTAKAAQAIREVVSSTILSGIRDPRVKNVTVLRVEVTPNLQSARVYVSVLGDEKVQALTMHGLNASRGFLQSKVAARVQTRNTPILKFILDQGVKRSAAASVLLKELLGDQAGTAGEVERDAEIESLASMTSGGRPGPLTPPPAPPTWNNGNPFETRFADESPTAIDDDDDLETDDDTDDGTDDDEGEEFTDDKDQPN
ncbi:MAG: 30S ribosome-binding factor RbfA [Planctomycetales bacterium]|nr:30S ribosome-binding factor RbfA [Planctomycetales bacterium]